MILNLLRVEALRVEEMIKRSFSENASQKSMPEKQRMFENVRCRRVLPCFYPGRAFSIATDTHTIQL
jgi:antiviral helicase SKI2